MFARILSLALTAVAVIPADAAEMKAEEARHFVAGKAFAFNCFEGTRGAGRIYNDGSVAGSIQFAGEGPVRYVRLPPGTLRIRGESVCASVKGLFFEPCFNLEKTTETSFRGAVSGLGFAYCDFRRQGVRRPEMVRTRARIRKRHQPTETVKVEPAALSLRPSAD